MERHNVWAIVAGTLVLAAGFSFFNLAAAANLGYGALSGGNEIIVRWWYAFLVCLTLAFACVVAFWRARRAARR